MEPVMEPAAGVAATVKEGDWMCPSCNNHNFASRQVCNRCGGAKPPPEGKGQPGDWMCPMCQNHNYRMRQVCNKCAAPKPGGKGGFGPAMCGKGCGTGGVMGYGMGGVMGYGMGGGKGGAMGMGCGMGGGMGYGMGGGKGGAMGMGCGMGGGMEGQQAAGCGGDFRQGDWVCAQCGNHNYAKREVCNKCSAPRPANGHPGGLGKGCGGPLDPYGCWGGKGYSPYSQPGPQMLGGKACGKQLRPGDWVCPGCQNHNYASRTECNKCGQPKAQQVPPNFRPGDWLCPSCGNHNFASKAACNKCQEPKPAAE